MSMISILSSTSIQYLIKDEALEVLGGEVLCCHYIRLLDRSRLRRGASGGRELTELIQQVIQQILARLTGTSGGWMIRAGGAGLW